MEADAQLKAWFDKSQQISPVRIRTLSRQKLMEMFHTFGFTRGAEIGVDKGRFSEQMCQAMPGLDLVAVDPWDKKLKGEWRSKLAIERLRPYKNCRIDMRTSSEAVLDIKDGSLDFVYIDGDHHFDYVMNDIINWSRKVREGGVVAGHDYYHFRQAGVIPAVDIYTQQHGITKWFLTDYLKDRTPSFFWLKEGNPWT